ncbi:uncharacterized protein LOC131429715 isoform X2 [Malaya genurostris]|uniref:uncharacterized protein LOC131429715 isoform X2 n=1 Tax=Malaya genurostris TaxID=325434 RepID=UPI0026F39565|nr:uncharacterized protein LOC131429715 isoform X2 [Malaya genurostris]
MSGAARLVQYVVVNGEIAQSWPKGAVIAQCCHAVSAVAHMFSADPDTIEYFKDLDNMHKVVLELSFRSPRFDDAVKRHKQNEADANSRLQCAGVPAEDEMSLSNLQRCHSLIRKRL